MCGHRHGPPACGLAAGPLRLAVARSARVAHARQPGRARARVAPAAGRQHRRTAPALWAQHHAGHGAWRALDGLWGCLSWATPLSTLWLRSLRALGTGPGRDACIVLAAARADSLPNSTAGDHPRLRRARHPHLRTAAHAARAEYEGHASSAGSAPGSLEGTPAARSGGAWRGLATLGGYLRLQGARQQAAGASGQEGASEEAEARASTPVAALAGGLSQGAPVAPSAGPLGRPGGAQGSLPASGDGARSDAQDVAPGPPSAAPEHALRGASAHDSGDRAGALGAAAQRAAPDGRSGHGAAPAEGQQGAGGDAAGAHENGTAGSHAAGGADASAGAQPRGPAAEGSRDASLRDGAAEASGPRAGQRPSTGDPPSTGPAGEHPWAGDADGAAAEAQQGTLRFCSPAAWAEQARSLSSTPIIGWEIHLETCLGEDWRRCGAQRCASLAASSISRTVMLPPYAGSCTAAGSDSKAFMSWRFAEGRGRRRALLPDPAGPHGSHTTDVLPNTGNLRPARAADRAAPGGGPAGGGGRVAPRDAGRGGRAPCPRP